MLIANLFKVLVVLVALLAPHLLLPLGLRFELRLLPDEHLAGLALLLPVAILEAPVQLAALLTVALVRLQLRVVPCCTWSDRVRGRQNAKTRHPY